MIPIVCTCSFLFGNWSLIWDEKSGRYKTNYYFIVPSLIMLIVFFYIFYTSLENMVLDETIISTNPQYVIVFTIYTNLIILVVNRIANVRHGSRFANELMNVCGRTVESGRRLPEFWLRTGTVAASVYLRHYKYRRFSGMRPDAILIRMTGPLVCCVFTCSTTECLYTSACHAIADEFAAINARVRDAVPDPWSSRPDAWVSMSKTHCALTRLVRLFNDEYGVPMLLTTLNLLLCQIFLMNDIASVFVDNEKFEPSYANFAYFHDAIEWTVFWFRFWWICYEVDNLIRQVHLTPKIMLQKDINSFPENTRHLALDFLDQLIHRRVKLTACGFYDINKELLFMVLGYQFGLCLICTQFTTSGIQILTNLTIVQKNTTRIS